MTLSANYIQRTVQKPVSSCVTACEPSPLSQTQGPSGPSRWTPRLLLYLLFLLTARVLCVVANKVWDNCQTFNEPGSEVYNGSVILSDYFNQLWQNGEVGAVPRKQSGPERGRPGAKSTSPNKPSLVKYHGSQKVTVSVRPGTEGHGAGPMGYQGHHGSGPLGASGIMSHQYNKQDSKYEERPSLGHKKVSHRSTDRAAPRKAKYGVTYADMDGEPEDFRDRKTAFRGPKQRLKHSSGSDVRQHSMPHMQNQSMVPPHLQQQSSRQQMGHANRPSGVRHHRQLEGMESQTSIRFKFTVKPGSQQQKPMGEGQATQKGGDKVSLRQNHPLHRSLLVIQKVLESREGQYLSRMKSRGVGNDSSHVTLDGIKQRLLPGLTKGWGTIMYKSTADVLDDIVSALRSQRSAAHDNKWVCDAVETEFRSWWVKAGLERDLHQIGHLQGDLSALDAPLHRTLGSPDSGGPARSTVDLAKGDKTGSCTMPHRVVKKRKHREPVSSNALTEQRLQEPDPLELRMKASRRELEASKEELHALHVQHAEQKQRLRERFESKRKKHSELQNQMKVMKKHQEKATVAIKAAQVRWLSDICAFGLWLLVLLVTASHCSTPTPPQAIMTLLYNT